MERQVQQIIGRETELASLIRCISSSEAEFIAVYGRRRVGKTFLVKQMALSLECKFFEVTGVKNGSLKEQLANFVEAMAKTFHVSLINLNPKTWKEAFTLFSQELARLPPEQTVVAFFDELPWLATKKSLLMQQVDHFWNSTWSMWPKFKLIVCGSAASWMLEKLIHDKGGLYNRITKAILVKPFNLFETERFLLSRGVKLNRKQILELYMVMGGIPHYLKNIEAGKSATQNINQLSFTPDGILFAEFEKLFASLFDNPMKHEHIIQAIASKRYGISRAELLKTTKMRSGGEFIKILKELEASGFIKKFVPYDKVSKDQYFKIIDEYTMFYLKWIAPIKNRSITIKSNYWHTQYKMPAWQSWAGYSFESVCYKHIEQITYKLGIENIGCIIGSWRYAPPKNVDIMKHGVQIDLLFDRDDGIITICEIKYNESAFMLDKQYAIELIKRNTIFTEQTRTAKQIFTCLVTSEPAKHNVWYEEVISSNVVLDDLFFNRP